MVPDKFRDRKVMAAAIQLKADAVEVRKAVWRFKFIFSNLLLWMSCLLFILTFNQLPPTLIIVIIVIIFILFWHQIKQAAIRSLLRFCFRLLPDCDAIRVTTSGPRPNEFFRFTTESITSGEHFHFPGLEPSLQVPLPQ